MSRKRRRRVVREERVKPPREAAQHQRPWPMSVLLALGPHAGGIDADEFESGLQIVETFKALTHGLGVAGLSADFDKIASNYSEAMPMSDRVADRCRCWFHWAARLPRGLPARLVEWIEDETPIGSVTVLRMACRLWDKVRSDRALCASPLDATPPIVQLPRRGWWTVSKTTPATANPPNFPVQRHQPRQGLIPQLACAGPTPRAPLRPVTAHAHPSKPAPPRRG